MYIGRIKVTVLLLTMESHFIERGFNCIDEFVMGAGKTR
jgi:hypothetical protein